MRNPALPQPGWIRMRPAAHGVPGINEPVEKVAAGLIGGSQTGLKTPKNRALVVQTEARKGTNGVFQQARVFSETELLANTILGNRTSEEFRAT